jgi:hypothetical protein
MSKIWNMLPIALVALCLCGCEQFQRFEAWKRETFLGEPPAQPMAPTYPMYGYQQQPTAQPLTAQYRGQQPMVIAQPVITPATMTQVASMPTYSPQASAQQPAKTSGLPPMAQPVSQPILVPASQ